MSKDKWTLDQIQEHIKSNNKDVYSYSMAVVIAGFYKKLYGELPKIGLSGMQAEFAKQVCEMLP